MVPQGGGGSETQGELVGLTLRLTPNDAEFLKLAEETLISRCMAERGHVYEVGSLPEGSSAFATTPPRWTAAVDVETARLEGYGLFESLSASQGSPDEEADVPPDEIAGPNSHVASLPSDEQRQWMEALHGTEENTLEVSGAGESGESVFLRTDGCVAEMEQALYGELRDFLSVELAISAAVRSQQENAFLDEQVVAAGRDWVSCMLSRGYAVESPEDATEIAEEAYESRPLDQARLAEIDIAVADAECVEESGVNSALQQAFAEQEERLVKENAALFTSLQRLQEEAVRRARELLASD